MDLGSLHPAWTWLAVLLTGGALGWLGEQTYGPRSELAPIWLLDLEPLVWGLLASFTAGIVVSLMTRPPNAELVDRLFPPSNGEGQAA